MAYNLNATLSELQTEVEGLDAIHLYVLNASQSGVDYQYYADWNHDIVGYQLDSNGNILSATTTYTGVPIQGDVVKSNIEGEITGISLSIPNVDRTLESILHSQEYLRGKDIYVITTFARYLPSDSDNYKFIGSTPDKNAAIKEKFYIDSAQSTEQAITFSCKSKFDIKKARIPRRTFSHECQWEYNSTECGVSVADYTLHPTCDLSIENCRTRNNASRFGGFLSITRSGIYISR